MEILAVVVLGLSALVGFSTSAPKPKFDEDRRSQEDPDWAFTQAGDSNDSSERE